LSSRRRFPSTTPARIDRRQVFDLPEPKLEITEHQVEVKTCACGCLNRAAFPPEAAAPVLSCDRLEGGFARLRCPECHAEHLVAFSCRTRNFSSSCQAKRRLQATEPQSSFFH
jgi:hypothetical protein